VPVIIERAGRYITVIDLEMALQEYNDFVIAYSSLFVITNNGTIRISTGDITRINAFVDRFTGLFALNGYYFLSFYLTSLFFLIFLLDLPIHQKSLFVHWAVVKWPI